MAIAIHFLIPRQSPANKMFLQTLPTPLHRSSLLSCGLSRKLQSHTVSGSLFAAPPCSPAHLPGPVHHGLSDAGRDINNKSWSRNHSGEHKREREGRRRPQPARLQVSSFDTALMAVWWVHMGRHGFIRTCLHARLHNIYGVYARPTISFFLYSEGGFSCGKLLRKKQLRIPKQYTTMGDIICAMCVPCLSQFFVWNGLAIFNLRTTEPTYRQTTNWMKGRGMSGHGNCLLWSSNSSVLP